MGGKGLGLMGTDRDGWETMGNDGERWGMIKMIGECLKDDETSLGNQWGTLDR